MQIYLSEQNQQKTASLYIFLKTAKLKCNKITTYNRDKIPNRNVTDFSLRNSLEPCGHSGSVSVHQEQESETTKATKT